MALNSNVNSLFSRGMPGYAGILIALSRPQVMRRMVSLIEAENTDEVVCFVGLSLAIECRSFEPQIFHVCPCMPFPFLLTLNSSASCFWSFVSLLAFVFPCQAFWPAAQFLSMLVAKTPDLHRLNRKSHPAHRHLLFVEFFFLSLDFPCFPLGGTSRADLMFQLLSLVVILGDGPMTPLKILEKVSC